MARRVNPAEGKNETAEHEDPTPMAGGSAGVPAEVTKAPTHPGHVSGAAAGAPNPDAPPSPPVKRYMVEGAGPNGKHLLISGYKALFKDGKIVDDVNYDIEALKQQGLRLRPLEG